ncbi:protein FAF-like, chloroplastic [Solanum pennellii]|uniref:Protein FAF-like, chloroplastic n=1 Tax=Solanum pennellii TaxID=28526 RepID=A0ABM1GYV4_SOLPN|nr:protein FAF-like, chloroplastic [Solanum pennellii]
MSIKMAKEAQQHSIPLPPPLPPTKMGIVKQGIVSILGTDTEKRNKGVAASIRRTLSADMSSKKWLSQNGFSPMKKIASSKELDVLGQDEIWRSIQNGGSKTSNDAWSSILNQKNEESSTLPPPYIHPLLKKSSSSLTDKSLEICTESLGSETGSEIISLDHHHLQKQQQVKEELSPQTFEEFPVVKFHHNKKSSSPLLPKSFPPTISSLAAEDNKPSVHMQSHRQNGRLIVEAVSVPPQNHFRVERVDGRLLLTLITTSSEIETEDVIVHQDEFQEFEHNEPDRDDGKGNDTKGMQIVLERKSRLSNGRMNVNTSTLMMKQLMGVVSLEKKNKKYPNKIHNNSIKLIEDEDVIAPIIPQSLSTHLITPEASPFNAYNYFWKKNPNPSTTPIAKSTTKVAEQQDLVLMRENKGNINYLVPMLKGCKEQRKSLLIWEPYCIATS